MGRQKGKKGIRDILKERKSALHKPLEQIWRKAQREFYSGADEKKATSAFHLIIKIEENLNLLISDNDKSNMTDEQLFVLSASACLYDTIKCDTSKAKQVELADEEIHDKAINFGLSDMQARIIQSIANYKSVEGFAKLPELMDFDSEKAVEHIPFLIALFKLASILPKEKSKLTEQNLINGWTFSDVDDNCILFLSSPEEEKDFDAVFSIIESGRREIQDVIKILKNSNYPYYLKPDFDEIRFIENLYKKRAGKLDIGMNYYNISEFDIFKGRNKSIETLQTLIKENPICLLTGECGTGKSSLINAGILPYLRREGWRYVCVRPEHDKSMLNQLVEKMLPKKKKKISSMDEFLQHITEKYFQTNIIIALDQFECLVDPTFSSESAEDFIKSLAIVEKYPLIRFIIAYRSDFEGKLRYLWNEIADDPRGLPNYPLSPLNKSETAEVLKIFFEENKVNVASDEVLEVIAEDLFQESQKITRARGVFPPFIQMVAEALRNYVKMRDTQAILNIEEYDQEMGRAKAIISAYLKAMVRQVGEDTYIGRTVLYCLINLMGEREYRYLIAGKSYE
jgi:hypothetical protein